MKKLLLAVTFTSIALMFGVAVLPAGAENGYETHSHKVFVCKYVGTPFVDERLQTGDNPISVDIHAIPSFDPDNGAKDEADELVGDEFADQQGQSIVLEVDDGQPEPDVSECPPPRGPPTTTTTTTTTTKPPDEEPPGTTTTTTTKPPEVTTSTTTTATSTTATTTTTVPATTSTTTTAPPSTTSTTPPPVHVVPPTTTTTTTTTAPPPPPDNNPPNPPPNNPPNNPPNHPGHPANPPATAFTGPSDHVIPIGLAALVLLLFGITMLGLARWNRLGDEQEEAMDRAFGR